MTNGLLIGSPDWVREWRKMGTNKLEDMLYEKIRCIADPMYLEPGVDIKKTNVSTIIKEILSFIQSEITRAKEEHEHCYCQVSSFGKICCICKCTPWLTTTGGVSK